MKLLSVYFKRSFCKGATGLGAVVRAVAMAPGHICASYSSDAKVSFNKMHLEINFRHFESSFE